jgi:hypothetical protein
MTDFVNSKGLLWVTGLITFVMGTVIVALHKRSTSTLIFPSGISSKSTIPPILLFETS